MSKSFTKVMTFPRTTSKKCWPCWLLRSSRRPPVEPSRVWDRSSRWSRPAVPWVVIARAGIPSGVVGGLLILAAAVVALQNDARTRRRWKRFHGRRWHWTYWSCESHCCYRGWRSTRTRCWMEKEQKPISMRTIKRTNTAFVYKIDFLLTLSLRTSQWQSTREIKFSDLNCVANLGSRVLDCWINAFVPSNSLCLFFYSISPASCVQTLLWYK